MNFRVDLLLPVFSDMELGFPLGEFLLLHYGRLDESLVSEPLLELTIVKFMKFVLRPILGKISNIKDSVRRNSNILGSIRFLDLLGNSGFHTAASDRRSSGITKVTLVAKCLVAIGQLFECLAYTMIALAGRVQSRLELSSKDTSGDDSRPEVLLVEKRGTQLLQTLQSNTELAEVHRK